MPIPTPKKDQTKKEFIEMCAGNEVMNEEFPDAKKRLAVCYSQWDRAKEKKSKGHAESVNFENNIFGDFILLD